MKLRMIVLNVCLASLFLGGATMQAQTQQSKLIRLAEIDIDPVQLDAFKVELRQEIDASIHKNPESLRYTRSLLRTSPTRSGF